MKISFDYDGTLSREIVRKYAITLVQDGYDVYIVTNRFKDPIYGDNKDLFEHAKDVGIKPENIIFTCFEGKELFFIENNDFLFHVENDRMDIEEIRASTQIHVIDCVRDKNWIAKCNSLKQ